MARENLCPYEVSDVGADEEKLIGKCVYGIPSYFRTGGFVRCGAGRYVMPAKFRKCAAAIHAMKVRPDDVWVITFPRSGTTWTQEMVWLLDNNLNFEEAKSKPLYRRFPMLEITALVPQLGVQLIKHNFMNLGNFQGLDSAVRTPSWVSIANAPSPRYIKTHLPLSMLPPDLLDIAKVVYVARDPRDVAVSYFYLQKMVGKTFLKNTTFEQFWEAFRRDILPFTPVISHANEAWLQRHRPNLHLIFYEELKKDLPLEIRRMCAFLQRRYSEPQLAALAQHLSFDNLRSNRTVNNTTGRSRVQFIRKGEVGGWREHFDEKMQTQAEQYLSERLAAADIQYPTVQLDWEQECSRL